MKADGGPALVRTAPIARAVLAIFRAQIRGRSGPEMTLMATDVSDASADLAMMAGASVLASLTIPGRAKHVSEARSFVGKAVGPENPAADVAVLLTSEIVTNAVVHSNSRRAGGTVTVVVIEISGGLRVEVADDGSDLSTPVVKGDVYASDGHGLYLVQALADQWGYVREEAGTTVWFWLRAAACR
jgi:anti-sigma regulatory factor (Ser/Thr protein kinase)